MAFLATVATMALVYAMATQILNLEAGWGGMWDLGVAGLIAVGGYSYVLLTGEPDAMVPGLGLPIIVGMIGAALITAVVAALIGWPALRLRGEYFLISTFAFAEIIRQLIVLNKDLTGGTFGITAIARPFESAVRYDLYPYLLLAITAVLTAVVFLLCSRISGSVYGLVLRAARDNEPLAMATGNSIKALRMSTYPFVGLLIGFFVAPAFVWFLGAVVPSSFSATMTFTIWAALVIGGLGSRIGPVVGALLLTAVSEAVRLVEVAPSHAGLLAAVQPALVGVLLIAVLRWRPSGLFSERSAFDRKRRIPHTERGPELLRENINQDLDAVEGERV
ncbi:branched-chain amino acid ABC transporter permease [Rhodococcus sp. NPDC057529]|uniref:branched-chain amino acid ABC transporter permease n=1 Tax=Rhodococcus sp. NPDC057529 TaxID=3346158 RepID=UPI00366D07CB